MAPSPVSKSPAAASLPSSWIAAAKNGLPRIVILMPLYSAGLCEPVIIMPASAPK